MNSKEADFDKWFINFSKQRDFNRIFVSDEIFTPLVCAIARIETFENSYITSLYSSFAYNVRMLRKAKLSDPLSFALYANRDYSKAIICFFESNGEMNKIKVYPDLKSISFKCYCQENSSEQENIDFIEQHIDRTDA